MSDNAGLDVKEVKLVAGNEALNRTVDVDMLNMHRVQLNVNTNAPAMPALN